MKTVYRCLCATICLWLLAHTSVASSAFYGSSVTSPPASQNPTVSTVAGISGIERDESKAANQLSQNSVDRQFSEKDLAAAQQVTQSLGIAEWLGPLAPLALSPFFGIACLSGLSLFGGDWFGSNNPFLGDSSPLHNEVVFGVFLVLTLITSLPRLTKISKPFVQMTDQLEAWAGIITMLSLKFLVTGDVTDATPENQIVMLGMLSATTDVFLMIAATLNVLVINSVKFFCEMFIWIIPIPLIDAAFEALNKSACAALMMIYGYSPYLATCINLGIFLVAAVVFRWVYRQEIYFRTVLLDAALQKIFPAKSLPTAGLIVFAGGDFRELKYRSRCVLTRTDGGWQLVQRRLLRSAVILQLPASHWKMAMSCGLFAHTIQAQGVEEKIQLTFTRKYHLLLPELSDSLGVTRPVSKSPAENDTLSLLPD